MNATGFKQEDPYKVVGHNMVSVCSHCFPGNTITMLFPDLAGLRISHGICKGHAKHVLEQFRATLNSASK